MDFEIAAKKRKERKKNNNFKTAGRWLTEPMMEIFCVLYVLLRLFFVVRTRAFSNPESLFVARDNFLWL
jgi:hypothetical protein